MMKTEILKIEEAISFTKQTLETELKKQLELTRVSAPIAVMNDTGVNDDLSGVERSVVFPVKSLKDKKAVIVNSLAKWKKIRLKELEVSENKGIFTDMRAIRPDEDYSHIHSIYVDQWDWEKRISDASRSLEYLKTEVKKIYASLKNTEEKIHLHYPDISPILPEEITFIHSEELLQMYPTLSPKQREYEITKKFKAVFLIGIGKALSNTKSHDHRAPDYDDWITKNEDGYYGLNGDILLWNPMTQNSFEISSMGIRVDKSTLMKQLQVTDQLHKQSLFYHQLLLSDELPESIGGGIGQSRMCMFLLRKRHIGEVQVGIWPDKMRAECAQNGIHLL
ncbi:aspartate--ammonia ligase [Psychroflexus halocasei]